MSSIILNLPMRKCKICGDKYEPKYSSLEPCPKYECRLKLAEKILPKAKKQVEKQHFDELKEKITDWRSKLQTKVQEIARLIDYGQTCLATQRPAGQYHGGHIFSRGSHSNMALNLHNIHRQAANSNHWQNDDRLMHEGVKREYGMEYYTQLVELNGFKLPKFSNSDYQDMYKVACSISNDLKKDLRVYSTEDRIALRKKFNKMIGIYLK